MSGTNPLVAAHSEGQSLWLDFIQRSMLDNGELEKLIQQDGIRGITSNPSIFEAAIANTDEYDPQIRSILEADSSIDALGIFKQLAVTDIAAAADVFKPVYQDSRGDDGMVSLEVSPTLAHDSDATVAEAVELHQAVNRDNAMIKVPGTAAGVSAFEELTAKGISVNVTLLFSVARYQEIVQAYLRGLERRLNSGQPIDRIASVASFFVSRVDSAVDAKLAELNDQAVADKLMGKIAIANAKVAYTYYQNIFHSSQFDKLAQAGAIPQRLLWASTGTKNPDYSDVYYVEELMGPNTVNTVPPKTMDAFRDHGVVENRLEQGLDLASQQLDDLAATSVNLEQITQSLEQAGVESFAEAFDRLLTVIDAKTQQIKSS
jgi:transaldolase